MKIIRITIICIAFFNLNQFQLIAQIQQKQIVTGAERIFFIKATIKNKKIAVVANQTSMVGNTHLVDTLLALGADIKRIFCPEHGFRGTEDAGEHVNNSIDVKTGIQIVSLYGKKNKPTAQDLAGIDLVIYDIQDVGVRFYTYISTLTYVMQACAENFVPLFILDRPDPNGFYVDGPVMENKYKSFVGMHPIPIVYGMTVGELAEMINEEGWLPNHMKCTIGVIYCLYYTHALRYSLPVNPSPNLRNMQAVYLYPSLGLFEGTAINVGRGTDFPFQVFGHPDFSDTLFSYTPVSAAGVKINPVHNGKICYGVDLRFIPVEKLSGSSVINLDYLLLAYKYFPDKDKFFNAFFENLTGTGTLRNQIIGGMTADEIRESWQPGLQKFKDLRKKYLRYPDF
jgi:uncharacterized protein YbbC (DUF1343 family)